MAFAYNTATKEFSLSDAAVELLNLPPTPNQPLTSVVASVNEYDAERVYDTFNDAEAGAASVQVSCRGKDGSESASTHASMATLPDLFSNSEVWLQFTCGSVEPGSPLLCGVVRDVTTDRVAVREKERQAVLLDLLSEMSRTKWSSYKDGSAARRGLIGVLPCVAASAAFYVDATTESSASVRVFGKRIRRSERNRGLKLGQVMTIVPHLSRRRAASLSSQVSPDTRRVQTAKSELQLTVASARKPFLDFPSVSNEQPGIGMTISTTTTTPPRRSVSLSLSGSESGLNELSLTGANSTLGSMPENTGYTTTARSLGELAATGTDDSGSMTSSSSLSSSSDSGGGEGRKVPRVNLPVSGVVGSEGDSEESHGGFGLSFGSLPEEQATLSSTLPSGKTQVPSPRTPRGTRPLGFGVASDAIKKVLTEAAESDAPFLAVTVGNSATNNIVAVPVRIDGGVAAVYALAFVEMPQNPASVVEFLAPFTDVLASQLQMCRLVNAMESRSSEFERASVAKTEFLARVSHELRTPLNAILGYGQVLQLDDGDVPLSLDQKEAVDEILKGGSRLLELVNDVLDLSTIEAGRMAVRAEHLCLEVEVLTAMESTTPQAIEKGIAVEVLSDMSELKVVGDQSRVGQVLINLLTNAIKYNVVGGSVTIRHELVSNSRLRVYFYNTGPGIPAKRRSELFVAFNRLNAHDSHRVQQGTGLGLVLCQRLLSLMNGSIGLSDSEGDEGTEFWIELPYISNDDHVTADGATPSPTPNQFVVLYLGGSSANQAVLRQVLKRHRPNITLVGERDGDPIVAATEQQPHLIVVDTSENREMGVQAVGRLYTCTATQHIPVFVLCVGSPEFDVSGISSTAPHSSHKPIDASFAMPIEAVSFLRALDVQLRSGRGFHEHLQAGVSGSGDASTPPSPHTPAFFNSLPQTFPATVGGLSPSL